MTAAALEVGSGSLSQFTRDYARMLGTPPKRGAAALKALTTRLEAA